MALSVRKRFLNINIVDLLRGLFMKKKQSYSVVVSREFFSNLSDLLTSPFPRKLEYLRVSVLKGKKEVKSYYVKEHPFGASESFDAFIGRLYRSADVDVILRNEIAFFYVTSNPHYENEVVDLPLSVSSGEFFQLLIDDFHFARF